MLVVVRHGRTAWNAQGRFQGWADVPLDEEGRRQSERVATSVADLLDSRSRPVLVVSSDLCRAAATARAVAGGLGVAARIDRDLREVDVGRWEGLTHDEARERHPVEYDAWAAGRDLRRGGGETRAEAGGRVAAAIRSYLEATPGDLVVVGHGMSLRSALDLLARAGAVDLVGPAPHLGNAEHLVLQDWRHDQNERLLSER